MFVLRSEPYALVGQIRHERVVTPCGHNRQVPRIERDVLVLLNSVVNAVLVVELPPDEFLRELNDVKVLIGTVLFETGNAVNYLHLLCERFRVKLFHEWVGK